MTVKSFFIKSRFILSLALCPLLLCSVFVPQSLAQQQENGNFLAQLEAADSSASFINFYKETKNIIKEQTRGEVEILFMQARRSSAEKKFAAAIAACEKIISLSSRNTDAMFMMGQNYLWQSDYKKAREWFLKTLQISPGHIDSKISLAKTCYFMKDKKSAEKEFEEIYAAHPENSYVMEQYAQYLAWSSRLEKSASIYKKVLAADYKNTQARLGLAKVLSWQKKYPESIKILKECAEDGGCDSFEVRLELARVYLFADKLRSSYKLYFELAKERPSEPRVESGLKELSGAFLAKGVKLYNEKKYNEAGEYFNYTIAKFPSNRQAYKYSGLNHAARGELEYALGRFAKYLKYEKNDYEIMILAAEYCLKLNFKDEAVIYYRKASNIKNGDPALDYIIAGLERSRGAETEALNILDNIVKKNSSDYRARLLRADINYSLSRLDEFEKEAPVIIEYRSRNDEAAVLYRKLMDHYIKAGKELVNSKKYVGAVRYYDQILNKIGDNYDVLMRCAEACSRAGDYARAVSRYKRVLAIKPGDYDARIYIALNLSWDKKYNDAIEEYKKILGDYPSDSEAAGGIARTYFWMARFFKSLTYYKKAYSLPRKSAETITGYGNSLAIFSRDKQAIEKIDEALAKDKNYSYALELKNLILRNNHMNELKGVKFSTKDSDGIISAGEGGEIEVDLDLNTRLSASYKHYEIYNENSPLRYKAETTGLKFKTQVSPLYRIFGGATFYDLRGPAGNAGGNTGYVLGVTYNKIKHLSMSLYFDRSLLFENPVAFRNRISSFGPNFELKRTIDDKYDILFSAGLDSFSDSNTKKSLSLKLNRIFYTSRFKLTAGPLYKNVRFAQKKYSGYYSPERYDSCAAQYILAYSNAPKTLDLIFNEEYGKSKELGRSWKNYHKYQIEAQYKLKWNLAARILYLKTNSGLDGSSGVETSGYWYQSVNGYLDYKW
ncbi:MAG TPA: tetratricopeptide repeat protein [Candidatus Wallbacteria bacterium]|nr:tetratricopeptide repeat protein [Candidatus Wallbacteria bacterium]